MSDASVISDETGKVIAIVINNTRYSPEAILMLQTNTINLVDHERSLVIWKEVAADAMNAYEDERCRRLEAEAKLERYAQRVSDAESATSADIISRVVRYARDYVHLGTDVAFEGLANAIVEYDKLRQRHGK